MVQTIKREQLRQELASQHPPVLIEVLNADSYNDYHLPGAMHVPLRHGFEQRLREVVPNKNTRVVVYCRDARCGAAEEAVAKMIDLGYTNVVDYEAGKTDWKRAGLPIESPRQEAPRLPH